MWASGGNSSYCSLCVVCVMLCVYVCGVYMCVRYAWCVCGVYACVHGVCRMYMVWCVECTWCGVYTCVMCAYVCAVYTCVLCMCTYVCGVCVWVVGIHVLPPIESPWARHGLCRSPDSGA